MGEVQDRDAGEAGDLDRDLDAADDGDEGAVSDLHQRYGSRLAQLFIFEQRDMANDPTGREGNFGAVKTDGTPKGAFFNAIQSLVNTYRG